MNLSTKNQFDALCDQILHADNLVMLQPPADQVIAILDAIAHTTGVITPDRWPWARRVLLAGACGRFGLPEVCMRRGAIKVAQLMFVQASRGGTSPGQMVTSAS